MKRLLVVVAILLSVAAFGQHKNIVKNIDANKKNFIIKGTVKGITSGTAILKYLTGEKPEETISAIVNGKFNFTGKLSKPQEVTVEVKNYSDYDNTFKFFAENAAITINADTTQLENPVILGSPVREEFIEYRKLVLPVEIKSAELNKTGRDLFIAGKITATVKDSLFKIHDDLENEKKLIITNFTKSHSASAASAWAITNNFLFDPKPEELEPLYDLLSSDNKSGIYGKVISEVIANTKKTSVGKPAIDFTQPDTNGKNIMLSSNKGKYLLVDFWASWCGPCRAENPTVVKVYNQYKNKGFDILGVSLDGDNAAWQKAIKADGLTWTQVSDLKGWNNTAAVAYGIKGIPFNVLLDKDGIIIGKNLRGANLENKLKEIFKD